MEALFEIGQKVVANKDHSQGLFKKGQEFTILDVMQSCCKVVVKITNDINDRNVMECTKCHRTFNSNLFYYFNQTSFSPIQEIGDMTIEEAILLVTQKEMV